MTRVRLQQVRYAWPLSALVPLVVLAWWVLPRNLPHPRDCTQEQLFHWLVLKQVADQPADVQLALMQRLAELLNGDSHSVTKVEIRPKYQAQVEANASVLLNVWIRDRLRSFAGMPSDQWTKFLDEQIRVLRSWQEFAQVISPGSEPSDAHHSIHRLLQQWMDSPDLSQHDLRQAIAATGIRWLATDDVRDMDVRQRATLVDELEPYIDSDASAVQPATWIQWFGTFTEREQAQLRANVDNLLSAWFRVQAQQFRELDASGRAAFVASEVSRIRALPQLLPLLATTPTDPSTPPNLMQLALMAIQTINRWIEASPPDDQTHQREFLAAVQAEYLGQSIPWLRQR